MFISENVEALFKRGKLSLVSTEDGQTRRGAEATLVIEPFTVELARELGEELCGHFYDDDGGIRAELDDIDLIVRLGVQRVTVRTHAEVDAIVQLEPVSIKDLRVKRMTQKRTGAVWLACSFVLVFSLETKAVRNFFLDYFGAYLVWTFQAIQDDLLNRADVHESIARMGEAGLVSVTGPDGKTVHVDEDLAKRHRAKARALRDQAKVTH